MNRETLRRVQGVLCAFLLLGSGAARAVDGVIEINHTSATATGYPVPILAPGSYRLTGNLTPPPGIGGIFVGVTDVEIDLNGFAILGSGGGPAPGIASVPLVSGLVVRNGTVSGFGGAGVVLGTQSKLLQMRIASNGAGGVTSAAACLIVENVIFANLGGDGLLADGCKIENNVIESNATNGISGNNNLIVHNRIFGNGAAGVLSPGHTLVAENTISNNAGAGIFCGPACNVRGNAVELNNLSVLAPGGVIVGPGSNVTGNNISFNTGVGLTIPVLSGYSNNALHANTGVEVSPAAHPTDGFFNICDGAAC